MALIENSISTLEMPKIKSARIPLNVAAGTANIFTAVGDVYVEVLAAYVSAAGAGFTSLSITTDHAVPKTIVANTLVASIVLDASATLSGTGFVLPDGKHIRGTLVGAGSAGEIVLVVRCSSITPGATLS